MRRRLTLAFLFILVLATAGRPATTPLRGQSVDSTTVGCERIEQGFAALFDPAGLKLETVHLTPAPAPTPVSVVEAIDA
jgi:hypothetical protein